MYTLAEFAHVEIIAPCSARIEGMKLPKDSKVCGNCKNFHWHYTHRVSKSGTMHRFDATEQGLCSERRFRNPVPCKQSGCPKFEYGCGEVTEL
jgi:hypothetical protein